MESNTVERERWEMCAGTDCLVSKRLLKYHTQAHMRAHTHTHTHTSVMNKYWVKMWSLVKRFGTQKTSY